MICNGCSGSGITLGRHWLEMAVGALLDAGASSIDPKPHGARIRTTLREQERHSPTKDLGELTTILAGREPDPWGGYDTWSRQKAAEKIIMAAGLNPHTWGICQACQGTGEQEEDAGEEKA